MQHLNWNDLRYILEIGCAGAHCAVQTKPLYLAALKLCRSYLATNCFAGSVLKLIRRRIWAWRLLRVRRIWKVRSTELRAIQ